MNKENIVLNLELGSVFLRELFRTHFSTGLSFLAILNTQISGFQLQSERLEKRFSSLSYKVDHLFKTKCKMGRQRKKLEESKYKVAIYESELNDLVNINFSLPKFEKEKFALDQKCRELYDQLRSEVSIRRQREKELELKEKEISDLHKCVELINEHHVSAYTGKPLDSLGKSQKLEKLQDYIEKAQMILLRRIQEKEFLEYRPHPPVYHDPPDITRIGNERDSRKPQNEEESRQLAYAYVESSDRKSVV